MATLKQRLHKKNSAGGYDTIHLETSADLVLMTDGTTKLSDKISTMDTTIAGKLASTGTAAKATKLATARTVRTNLASTSTASFDGSANITPGVTGVLPVANGGTGVTALSTLKSALGILTPSKPLSGISIGNELTISTFSWVCVHQDVSYNYLMAAYVIDMGFQYGVSSAYYGSKAAWTMFLFGTAIGVWGNAAFGNITVNGVTGYCFLPTYEQMNGGFSYFNSNERRKATTSNGTTKMYATCSPYTPYDEKNNIYVVGGGGGFTSAVVGNPNVGIRPVIALVR